MPVAWVCFHTVVACRIQRTCRIARPIKSRTVNYKRILVTGGTGYIGSHTYVALIEKGIEPVIVDNLCNSNPVVLDRIERITQHRPAFYQADVRDAEALGRIFRESKFDAVIHFAGLKSVRESVEKPHEYHLNNVEGSRTLLDAMQRAGVKRIIFSSSATVYGTPDKVPVPETAPLRPVNPYGETKVAVEKLLQAAFDADPQWRIGILRYFNPAGAHESGLIGEDPKGVPENLMPYVAQVAAGRLPYVRVFGNDYPTPDGTGIRDYIHVMDLAEGHVAALDHLSRNGGLVVLNLGTGRGYSVLEMIKAFEAASGKSVPYQIMPRRPGDIAICYADVRKSHRLLDWRADRGLGRMCEDAWQWQPDNSNGYAQRGRLIGDS